jgi:hypothetical protein
MNGVKMLIAVAPTILLAAAAPAREPGEGEAAVGLQPGQWEIVTEITSVEGPGASEPFLQQLRTQMTGQRETQSHCLTPEQARDPARNMMRNHAQAGCQFADTAWTGGAMRVRATCGWPGSPPIRLALDGTYAARQIDGRLSMDVEIPNPAGSGPAMPLAVQARLTGRHTGVCVSQ